MAFDDFFTAYLEAALWSSSDDNGTPLDEQYDETDIDPATLDQQRAECLDFYTANASLWAGQYGHPHYSDDALAGQDFWLTRNGHGAGFWDRDLPDDIGDTLTDMAEPYGSVDLYVGDDGRVYA
ncbi:MAG: hypothetical protein ACK5VE_06515 [Alphaproteobacteria bacterium]